MAAHNILMLQLISLAVLLFMLGDPVTGDDFCSVPGRCKNNGHCVKGGDGYPGRCFCKPGYSGRYCEEDFCSVPDRCKNNGHCIKGGDGYPGSCYCKGGFTGKYCESPLVY